MRILLALSALLITSPLFAQAAGQAQPNSLMQFIPFLAIGLIFYFFMLRPQKKQMEQEKAMNEALKKGDEIYTKSGLIGVIAGLTEKIITLEVNSGVKIKILRSQVAGPATSLFDKETK